MSFETWGEFFHMGGYALYVWMSFGLSLLLLAAVMLTPAVKHAELKRNAARTARRQQREGGQ